jgi:tetratricopeptide (TPR) repeat protein
LPIPISGEYDRAISYLNQAVAIGPTPVGYFNLAVAYEKTGNFEEAIKNLRRYLEDTRSESEVNIQKARAELERLEKRPTSR